MHLKIQALVEFGLYDKLNYELTPVTMTLCEKENPSHSDTVLLFGPRKKRVSVGESRNRKVWGLLVNFGILRSRASDGG